MRPGRKALRCQRGQRLRSRLAYHAARDRRPCGGRPGKRRGRGHGTGAGPTIRAFARDRTARARTCRRRSRSRPDRRCRRRDRRARVGGSTDRATGAVGGARGPGGRTLVGGVRRAPGRPAGVRERGQPRGRRTTAVRGRGRMPQLPSPVAGRPAPLVHRDGRRPVPGRGRQGRAGVGPRVLARVRRRQPRRRAGRRRGGTGAGSDRRLGAALPRIRRGGGPAGHRAGRRTVRPAPTGPGHGSRPFPRVLPSVPGDPVLAGAVDSALAAARERLRSRAA